MPRYASSTEVPVERTKAEIEAALVRYGASEFSSGWNATSAVIFFRMNDLLIRFVLPLPRRDEQRFAVRVDRYGNKHCRTEAAAVREWDQEIRQRWRALLLTIKAKLEAVECGISTRESEFLANIVLPDDRTVGEWIIGQALPQVRGGQMPRLALPCKEGPGAGQVIDAESEVVR